MQCGLEVAAELRDGAWLLVAVSLEMNLSSTRQRINSGQFAAASRSSPAGRGPLDPPTWRFIYLIVVARTVPGARRRGRPHAAWMDNIKTWTGLRVEESVRTIEDRDKWRKYDHGVANRPIEDG